MRPEHERIGAVGAKADDQLPGGAADAEHRAVAVYPQVPDRRQLAEPGGTVSMPTDPRNGTRRRFNTVASRSADWVRPCVDDHGEYASLSEATASC